MPSLSRSQDWAKSIVHFLLGIVLVLEGVAFVWERLPQSVQRAGEGMFIWFVLNELTRYMLFAAVLALGFLAGLALIWRFLLRRG
jgi:hypothetical protein